MTNKELRERFFKAIDNATSLERLEPLMETINWNIKDERSRQLVMAYWWQRYLKLVRQGQRDEIIY